MRELEARYRAALRWYPESWRRRNADAVVGMLLDGADHDGRTVPAPGELTDLALRGLAARSAVVLPAAVRSGAATLAFGYGFARPLVTQSQFPHSSRPMQQRPPRPRPRACPPPCRVGTPGPAAAGVSPSSALPNRTSVKLQMASRPSI